MVFVVANFFSLNLTATIYVGMFFYINGMVGDLKTRLASINEDSAAGRTHLVLQPDAIWSIYVQEIEFHIEIIGYFLTFFIQLTNRFFRK